MSQENLRPCPACFGEDVRIKRVDQAVLVLYCGFCATCGTEGPTSVSQEDAAKTWMRFRVSCIGVRNRQPNLAGTGASQRINRTRPSEISTKSRLKSCKSGVLVRLSGLQGRYLCQPTV